MKANINPLFNLLLFSLKYKMYSACFAFIAAEKAYNACMRHKVMDSAKLHNA